MTRSGDRSPMPHCTKRLNDVLNSYLRAQATPAVLQWRKARGHTVIDAPVLTRIVIKIRPAIETMAGAY